MKLPKRFYLSTTDNNKFDLNTAKFNTSKQTDNDIIYSEIEQELKDFFLFFRDYGEHYIGMSIEEFIKLYIKKSEDLEIN